MALYLDTSALVKLVVAEPESPALASYLSARDLVLVSSDLSRTELQRAVRRVSLDRMDRVREVLATVTTTRLTAAICDAAGRLDPPGLRSLDALHLASALDLGDDLEALVGYDVRLADGARLLGIPVVAPA